MCLPGGDTPVALLSSKPRVLHVLPHLPSRAQRQLGSSSFPRCLVHLPVKLQGLGGSSSQPHSHNCMSVPGAFTLGLWPPSSHVISHPCDGSSEPLFLSASLVALAPSSFGTPLSACRIPYWLLATFLPTILSGYSRPPPASWSPAQAGLSQWAPLPPTS